MATTTIQALTAVLATDLDDTATVPVANSVGNTRKATIAQLRTQLNAPAQTFPATVTFSSATLSIAVAATISSSVSNTGRLQITGGSAVDEGANILLHGPGHGTLPSTIVFRAGTGEIARFRNNHLAMGTTDLEAWHSTYRAMQLGTHSAIMFGATTTGIWTMENAYYDAAWKYRTTAGASLHRQTGGEHAFWVAASGTIDTAITWQTGLTISNIGVVSTGAPASVLSATAGDLVLPYTKAIRSANSGGTGTVQLIALDAAAVSIGGATSTVATGTAIRTVQFTGAIAAAAANGGLMYQYIDAGTVYFVVHHGALRYRVAMTSF